MASAAGDRGEDWGKRDGYEKKVRLDDSIFGALQLAVPGLVLRNESITGQLGTDNNKNWLVVSNLTFCMGMPSLCSSQAIQWLQLSICIQRPVLHHVLKIYSVY